MHKIKFIHCSLGKDLRTTFVKYFTDGRVRRHRQFQFSRPLSARNRIIDVESDVVWLHLDSLFAELKLADESAEDADASRNLYRLVITESLSDLRHTSIEHPHFYFVS